MKNEKENKNETRTLNNNSSFTVISQNQKVENDKERIKSKFNFNISRTSTISSANKRSSLTTQQNSCLVSEKLNKIKKKIIDQNSKISNETKKKSKNKIQKNNFNNFKKINDNKMTLNQNNRNINMNDKSEHYMNKNFDNKNIINNKVINKLNDDFINNITYSNYENYYSENSSQIIEPQKNILHESILKTQTIEEGINNLISDDNIKDINSINNIENSQDIKINNEKEEEGLKKNQTSKSFKNTSFSGSSKTSIINKDMMNFWNMDIEPNEDNIKIVNNNNYVIQSFNQVIKTNNENKNNKTQNITTEENFLQKIFISHYASNYERKITEISELGLLDEDDYNQDNRKKMLNHISKYYFIEDIIKKHDNIISLSFEKFKNISNKAKYKIFSYTFDNYKNLLNTSKSMRNLILNMLEEKFESSIRDFSNKYKDILSLENYNFNIHKFNKQKNNKKTFVKFCLYLKSRVLPNNEYLKQFGDVSFEISYKYKVRNIKNVYNSKSYGTNISSQSYISKDHIQEEFTQIYKFDLRKDKNYPIWICSEKDEIFNNATKVGEGNFNLISKILPKKEFCQKHLIYSCPVINVNENDYIVFRIDLIENNNVIENFSFNEIIAESVNKNYFHKNSYKPERKFDNMRDCENEIAINRWHDESLIDTIYNNNKIIYYTQFIYNLKQYFNEYFEIIETKYDISKFIFIRMIMKAKKIGILKNSFFCNKDIEIVDKIIPLTKECIPINFVNTFSMNKNLVIRQDTILEFYIIE